MIVGMYMSKKVETIGPLASPFDAVKKMTIRKIRRLVVVDKERVVGMICHRDIFKAYPANVNPFSPTGMHSDPFAATVAEVMASPVETIASDEPLENATRKMTAKHIGGLPVTHGGKLAGIITESDIFRAFSDVLAGAGDAVRVTFEIKDGEDVVSYLVGAAASKGLELRSFVRFNDEEKQYAVARLRGKRADELVDDLWQSGRSVTNIVRL